MDISIPLPEQRGREALEICRYRDGMHSWPPGALKLRVWRFPTFGDWWSWSAFGPTANGHYCVRRVQWARAESRVDAVTYAEDANLDKDHVDALILQLDTLELAPFTLTRQGTMDGETCGLEFFGGAHAAKLQWDGAIPEVLSGLANWFENAVVLLDSKYRHSAYG